MAGYKVKPSFRTVLQRALRGKKLVILSLLFVLLTAAMAGVSTVLTGPNWESLWLSLIIGMLAGWLLAIFRWKAWHSALMLIVLGILFTLLFAGGLNERILAVFNEIFQAIGRVITTLNFKGVDLNPLSNSISQLFTATRVVLERVFTWITDIANGQPTFDPVAASIVWNAAVWLIAAWAGWVVEAGRNALLAVLPALILNLSTLSYGRINSVSIYLILALTLILIGVVQFDRREQEWNDTSVAYPERKGRELGNISTGLAILLVVLAALISSLSLQQIVHWSTAIRGSSPQSGSGLAKSLGIAPPATAVPNAFTNISHPGLPRSLLVGAGPELSTEQVMSVGVQDLSSLLQADQSPPLYWRSFTYDIYTGHGWSTSATTQSQYQPNQQIQSATLPGHKLVQEQVSELSAYGGTIYAAGEAVGLSVASTAAWRSSNDLFGILSPSYVYTVQSLVPVADETSLRNAGQAYPNWVAQRYLSVPAEVPTRVRDLAIQLTATEATPYDRAMAIENYLRTTYSYTLDVPYPPANQDLVDYFLFSLRKGYCDYYASAMVILARAAGVPSRLAIGYTSGTYNLKTNRFVVTQADAHSWVEVYFPEIGWVPFEPTASFSPFNRTGQATQGATPTPTPVVKPPTGISQIYIGKLIGYSILAIIVVLGGLWIIYDALFLRRSKPQQAAHELYRRLTRYALHLGVPIQGGETPYEFGELLSKRITQITMPGIIATGTATNVEVQSILHKIVRLNYRPVEAEADVISGMISQWQGLRWRLRLLILVKTWISVRHTISDAIGIKSGRRSTESA